MDVPAKSNHRLKHKLRPLSTTTTTTMFTGNDTIAHVTCTKSQLTIAENAHTHPATNSGTDVTKKKTAAERKKQASQTLTTMPAKLLEPKMNQAARKKVRTSVFWAHMRTYLWVDQPDITWSEWCSGKTGARECYPCQRSKPGHQGMC